MPSRLLLKELKARGLIRRTLIVTPAKRNDNKDLHRLMQQGIVAQLEGEVLSVDPAVLREEIGRLTRLIN